MSNDELFIKDLRARLQLAAVRGEKMTLIALEDAARLVELADDLSNMQADRINELEMEIADRENEIERLNRTIDEIENHYGDPNGSGKPDPGGLY